jgi:predicted HTH transcriptional regulator
LGRNPVNSILSIADKYVVAYLNSPKRQKGSIFWGVRDSDRKIVGVQLTACDRDKLRRVVTEKLHKISPTLAPGAYSIDIHPLYQADNEKGEMYLVEIKVPSSMERILFSTGNGEVYLKTDSGKKKLTTFELQRELIRRLTANYDD